MMITVRTFPTWLQGVIAGVYQKRGKSVQEAGPVDAGKPTSQFIVSVVEVDGLEPTRLLRWYGPLNYRTYLDFTAAAQAVYASGAKRLLIDLHEVTRLELSGLFALYNVARLFAGAELLDPEAGWVALRAAAEEIPLAITERVKLIAPSPAAEQALSNSTLGRCLELYPDVATAVAALDGHGLHW
jgi:hypothetical protein